MPIICCIRTRRRPPYLYHDSVSETFDGGLVNVDRAELKWHGHMWLYGDIPVWHNQHIAYPSLYSILTIYYVDSTIDLKSLPNCTSWSWMSGSKALAAFVAWACSSAFAFFVSTFTWSENIAGDQRSETCVCRNPSIYVCDPPCTMWSELLSLASNLCTTVCQIVIKFPVNSEPGSHFKIKRMAIYQLFYRITSKLCLKSIN